MPTLRERFSEPAAELVEIIDRGGRIRELARYFDRRRDALGFYATQQHLRYDPLSAFEQTCCDCMTRPSRNVVQFHWRAVVFTGVRVGWLDLLALVLFKFTIPRVKFDIVNFRTFHPFCNKCLREGEKDEKFAETMSGLAFGAGMLASMLALYALAPIRGQSRPNREMGWWVMSAAALLALTIWPMLRIARWARTPTTLRLIARPPFRLRSRMVIEDLPAAILAAEAGPQEHVAVEAADADRVIVTPTQIPSADR